MSDLNESEIYRYLFLLIHPSIYLFIIIQPPMIDLFFKTYTNTHIV